MTARAWLIVAVAYAAMSAVTFVCYGLDKRAARRGARRISEATLHLLSLAGGWPGALVAQSTFRHKTVKRSFRAVLWGTVVLNCLMLGLLVIWLSTTAG